MAGRIAAPRLKAGFYGMFLPLLILVSAIPAMAQNHLNRISVAERSDGLGYVIRYHLTEPVDSFRVAQPETDRIQLILYSEAMDTSGISIFSPYGNFEGFRSYRLPLGYGFELQLDDAASFRAYAYNDRSSTDLLLALEKSDPADIASLSAAVSPIDWDAISIGRTDSEFTSFLDDEFYNRNRSNLDFDTIVIDAGHGGKDPGTIGPNRLYEKNVTLPIAKKLGGYINEYMPDINVVYTRDDDTFIGLEERGSIANRARGDLFVSIHANAADDSRARGSEVFFLGLERSQTALEVMKRENSVIQLESDNEREGLSEAELLIYELANASNIALSEKIAEKMEYQFRERAGRHSRGVKQARFVVLYHASMPALLVEVGFISNPAEAEYLTSDYGQSIVASAVFRAIRDYRDEYEKSRSITRSD